MFKIVLYLGCRAEKKFHYFRETNNTIYRTATTGDFVDLTHEIEGKVYKISLEEETNKKYVFILTPTKQEFDKVLAEDNRWEMISST